MAFITGITALQEFNKRKLKFINVKEVIRIFDIKNRNTAYKLLQRLQKKKIIDRIDKGKYLVLCANVDDFEIANFLRQPSYISLETALSFYGILPQFVYSITSVTVNKTKKIIYRQKEFVYSHLSADLFFGFEKNKNFLIALPEKALLDQLYFVSKGQRSIEWKELDLTKINKRIFKNFCQKVKSIPFKRLVKKLNA